MMLAGDGLTEMRLTRNVCGPLLSPASCSDAVAGSLLAVSFAEYVTVVRVMRLP